eukprot:scaffold1144_cov215-Pinguiococcus_pyrenoidosus.AAC.7
MRHAFDGLCEALAGLSHGWVPDGKLGAFWAFDVLHDDAELCAELESSKLQGAQGVHVHVAVDVVALEANAADCLAEPTDLAAPFLGHTVLHQQGAHDQGRRNPDVRIPPSAEDVREEARSARGLHGASRAKAEAAPRGGLGKPVEAASAQPERAALRRRRVVAVAALVHRDAADHAAQQVVPLFRLDRPAVVGLVEALVSADVASPFHVVLSQGSRKTRRRDPLQLQALRSWHGGC